ncbi:MAG: hypothetical protein HY231_24075 [Acidobacteria bacterium]|nr:hypothetical protein [Acidobacteriota bacterium]
MRQHSERSSGAARLNRRQDFAAQVLTLLKTVRRAIRRQDEKEAYASSMRLTRFVLNRAGRDDGRGVQPIHCQMPRF